VGEVMLLLAFQSVFILVLVLSELVLVLVMDVKREDIDLLLMGFNPLDLRASNRRVSEEVNVLIVCKFIKIQVKD
jgi:hypothetical protein